MMYATVLYIGYTESQGISEHTFAVFMDFIPHLGETNYFSTAYLWTALTWQVTKLWYVYAGIATSMFLFATSQTPNDYKGMEHGSASFADKYAEKEFTDGTGIPIADNFYATIKRPKGIYYSPHNLNETVIGSSGTGKSFHKIKPDIMQMYGSYVVIDPKGELYRDTAKFLKANGYKVRVLNLYTLDYSHSYNPFAYMTSEQDVIDIADLFMKNSAGDGEEDNFWSGGAQDLLTALMLYLWKCQSEIKSFGRILRLINSIRYTKNGKIDQLCELARCMNRHKIDYPNDAATVNWSSMLGTPETTLGGIVKTLSTRLRLWSATAVDEFTIDDEMDFDSITTEKTAIFVLVRPMRNPYKVIVNMFYSQLFERLIWLANNKYGGRLPQLVSCELDEFPNVGEIPYFSEVLAVARSHNLRICIVMQGLSQLKALYEKTFDSILGNCSIFTFLGTSDMESNKYVSEKLGKTTVRIDTRSYNRGQQGGGSDNETYVARDLLAPDEIPKALKARGKSRKFGGNCIIFVDEFKPFFKRKFNTFKHPLFKLTGSTFPSGLKNNTDIAEEMAGVNEARRKRYETLQVSLFENMSGFDTVSDEKPTVSIDKSDFEELSQTTVTAFDANSDNDEMPDIMY
jgi:type IV secretion system protein VirD4